MGNISLLLTANLVLSNFWLNCNLHTVNLPMRLAGFNVFQQFLQAKKVVFLDFNVIK